MTVILLAAGLSRRMGENKLLLPFRGKTILSCSIENALGYSGSVIVVTGYEREKTEAIAREYPVRIIYAERYAEGQMQSSLKGIEAAPADFAIVPGDLPLLSPDDYKETEELLQSYTIARPLYEGTPGHPVMYRKIHREKLLSFGGTMKEYLQLFDVGYSKGSIGTIADTDTPSDYATLLRSSRL